MINLHVFYSGDEHSKSIIEATEFLKKHAPYLLQNQNETEDLQMENADLKERIEKLQEENNQLRKAQAELENKLYYRRG